MSATAYDRVMRAETLLPTGKMSPWRRILSKYIQQFSAYGPGPSSKVKAIVLFGIWQVLAMDAGFGFSAGLGMLANFRRWVLFRDGGNWQ